MTSYEKRRLDINEPLGKSQYNVPNLHDTCDEELDVPSSEELGGNRNSIGAS